MLLQTYGKALEAAVADGLKKAKTDIMITLHDKKTNPNGGAENNNEKTARLFEVSK